MPVSWNTESNVEACKKYLGLSHGHGMRCRILLRPGGAVLRTPIDLRASRIDFADWCEDNAKNILSLLSLLLWHCMFRILENNVILLLSSLYSG